MGRLWIPDTERKPLPTSGQIVGWLAELLRLKGALKDEFGADERTARRYFAGERIEHEKREAILKQLVDAVEPEAILTSMRDIDVPRDWLFGYVTMLVGQWDTIIGELRASSFPITDTTDAALPFLRMVMLDAGLRLAAVHVLLGDREPPSPSLVGLVHDSLKVAMDQCIASCGRKPTLEDIRREARVSKNSLDAWRRGTQIPHDENLRQLAACLASRGAGPEARVLSELRLGAAVSAAWHRLADTLSGRHWLDDHVEGMRRVVQHAVRFFARMPGSVDTELALRQVVVFGAHCTVGGAVSRQLASMAPLHDEVSADFLALPGDWATRINEHMKALGTIPRVAAKAAAAGGLPKGEFSDLTSTMMRLHFSLAEWDASPPPTPASSEFRHVVSFTLDDKGKAKRRLGDANRLWSAGRRAEAVGLLREATKFDSQNASVHYDLGCYLGTILHEHGRLELLDEALLELHLAIEMGSADPHMKMLALTEIGIVQSNAGLLQEALKTFELAEPVASNLAHFWSVRGSVFMWVGRLDEAGASFSRALELDGQNPRVLERLGAVKWSLGKDREAKDLARRVELLTGKNPETSYEAILRSWPRRQR